MKFTQSKIVHKEMQLNHNHYHLVLETLANRKITVFIYL